MTLTVQQAADLVGVSAHTIRRWVDRGYLKPLRPGAKPSLFLERDVIECRYERMPRTEHDALDALWADVLAHH